MLVLLAENPPHFAKAMVNRSGSGYFVTKTNAGAVILEQ
jgi:hypothetical protein